MAVKLQLDEAGTLLADPETYATVLHAILLAAFEVDIYHIDPLELYARISDKFRVQMPEDNENKVNAILMSVSTDAFYEDPLVFKSVAGALFYGDIGGEIDGEINDLTLPEVAWALFEVGINRDEPADLEPRVSAVIASVASREAASHPDPEQTPEAYTARIIAQRKEELVSQFELLGVPRSELHHELHLAV